MELLEAFDVFLRRDRGFFHSAALDFLSDGCVVVYGSFYNDHFYDRAQDHFRRPGFGLAVSCMYHSFDQRHPVFLYRHSGAVSGQNLYGGQASSDLFGARRVVIWRKYTVRHFLRAFLSKNADESTFLSIDNYDKIVAGTHKKEQYSTYERGIHYGHCRSK